MNLLLYVYVPTVRTNRCNCHQLTEPMPIEVLYVLWGILAAFLIVIGIKAMTNNYRKRKIEKAIKDKCKEDEFFI
jgi:hypothetical protein